MALRRREYEEAENGRGGPATGRPETAEGFNAKHSREAAGSQSGPDVAPCPRGDNRCSELPPPVLRCIRPTYSNGRLNELRFRGFGCTSVCRGESLPRATCAVRGEKINTQASQSSLRVAVGRIMAATKPAIRSTSIAGSPDSHQNRLIDHSSF